MRRSSEFLALWALLCSPCLGLSVTTSSNANALANALFNGPGITVLAGASYNGASTASGTFGDGPFGIGTGAILTNGDAVGALPGGNTQVNNGRAGSPYCGGTSSTSNAAVLAVNIDLDIGYDGIIVELILASEQPGTGVSDPIGIYLDGTLYSVDNNGNRLTAGSDYLQQPDAIIPPDSDTSYSQSSPPLTFTIFTSSGPHTMVVAICNYMNRPYNSALLINAQGCAGDDCVNELDIDYVTTTTTVPFNEATQTTSTIKASHTTSGTFIATVQAAPDTTTTTEEQTTTTTEEQTTTTEEPTTTTTEEQTTTTEEPTTTTTDYQTTTTEEQTTTTEEQTTTTEEQTTTTTDDQTTTTTEDQTTTTGTTEEATTSTTTGAATTDSESMSATTEPLTTTITEATTSDSESISATTKPLTTTTTTAETIPTTSQSELTTTTTAEEEPTTTIATTNSGFTITTTQSESETTIAQGESTTTTAQGESAIATAQGESTTTGETIEPTSTTAERTTTNEETSTSTTSAPVASSETSEASNSQVSSLTFSSSVQTTTGTASATESTRISVEQQSTSSTEFQLESSTTLTLASSNTLSQTPTSGETAFSEVSTALTTTTEVPPSTTTAAPGTPRNLPLIGRYSFAGCLGSSDSFTAFTEVTSDSKMTPELCISLAGGARYIGVNQETCFAAEALTGTELVADARCDLVCPGDNDQICGGIAGGLRRRAIPSNLLLTIYGVLDDTSSSSVDPILITTSTNGLSSAEPLSTEPATPIGSVTSSEAPTSAVLEPSSETSNEIPSSAVLEYSATSNEIPTSAVLEPAETSGRFPIALPTAGPYPTMHWTKGLNYTQTVAPIANTVTTVTYVTVNPSNPAYVVTTHVAVTLEYTPCGCENQVYPTVEMTTTVVPCRACGSNGENSIALTMPTAACEGQGEGGHEGPGNSYGQPFPPHKVENHKVYSETRSYYKPQPTMAKQVEPLPMSRHGDSEWRSHHEGSQEQPSLPSKNPPAPKSPYEGSQEHQSSPSKNPSPPNTPYQKPQEQPASPSKNRPASSKKQESYPTQAYVPPKSSQVSPPEDHGGFEAQKTWKTEASLVPTKVQDPEGLKTPNPVGPVHGPNIPVIVSQAGKFDLKCWTAFSIIFFFTFLFL